MTQIRLLFEEDGEFNHSDGSEIEEENNNRQCTFYILLGSAFVLLVILISIFIVYRDK